MTFYKTETSFEWMIAWEQKWQLLPSSEAELRKKGSGQTHWHVLHPRFLYEWENKTL